VAEDRDEPAVAAWRALLMAHSRLVPAMEKDLRAAGQVSLPWYDVLLELNAAPGRRLRMTELGQRAVLSRTRVSRVVDELAAAGLAERQPDAADGRSSFAVLTPAGRNALRRAWPVYREAIRRHLGAQLTPQQCREMATLLEQAAAGAEAGAPRTARR
jgi:DNA-binding MarR family transcriptional regulator